MAAAGRGSFAGTYNDKKREKVVAHLGGWTGRRVGQILSRGTKYSLFDAPPFPLSKKVFNVGLG